MKAIIGFGIGLVFAWFINWWIHKPAEVKAPPTPQQVQAQAKANWKAVNDSIGHGISMWVDYKHNVVCYTLRSTNGGVGLSCLPFTQVAGVPAQ